MPHVTFKKVNIEDAPDWERYWPFVSDSMLMRGSVNMDECFNLDDYWKFMTATRMRLGHEPRLGSGLRKRRHCVAFYREMIFSPDEVAVGGADADVFMMNVARRYLAAEYKGHEAVYVLHPAPSLLPGVNSDGGFELGSFVVHMMINRSNLINGRRGCVNECCACPHLVTVAPDGHLTITQDWDYKPVQ